MSARTARRLAVLTTALLLAMAPAAIAAGGPPPGKGGGGGEETLGNNLSVPTIFAGGIPGTPVIRSATMEVPELTYGPVGDKSPLYGGSYWLQKTEATWRATYRVADNTPAVTATANWSDNLTKHQWPARQPIRVEMVLYDPDEVLTGFVMTNLTPELDDRAAVFGTDGTTFQTPAAGSEGTLYARVFAPGARLSITRIDGPTPVPVVPEQAMTVEMNSGGAVTYGFNWGIKGKSNVPQPGRYTLRFSLPVAGAQIDALDPLDLNPVVPTAGVTAEEGEGVLYEPVLDRATNSTSLTITITTSGGGGGRP